MTERKIKALLATPLMMLAAVVFLLFPNTSQAAEVSCPSDIPVVQENNCSGPGSENWRLIEYSPDVAGFTTKTSVNLGESVTLKLGRVNTSAASTVRVDVYRMGYYGNMGGRLLTAASSASVAVNNLFGNCAATNPTTGLKSCSGWANSYTIPGSALPASGVYTVKLTTPAGLENTITFTVRDDARKAKVLFVVPTATYEAYNDWAGKSLYFDSEGGAQTVAGTPRAVKVSFDRPLNDPRQGNRFIGPDFYMVQWLEKQGYDVAYTEDVALHQNPSQLLNHGVDMISGHSEYWSLEQMKGFLAARDAGVNIASFSGNTAYWKVRYENGGRTLVCYKTAEGSGTNGSGEDGANDWGPDGLKGTADDALGLDQIAGTADDHPENSTTTFRDNGAPPGDPNAPEGGRVGPDMPENQLLGNMYYGAQLQADAFPLEIPPANAQGHYAGDRIWRNTGISSGTTTTIGTHLLGWEWDAIPTQAQYLSRQPAGVKPLTNSPAPLSQNVDWLQDEGRIYAKTPPPGQCACGQAVKYTAPSGALVFAAGTNDWAWGLAPSPDGRIIQATYNILSDMGAQPETPVELTLDPPSGPQPPVASFSVSPNPAQANKTVTFDGTASTDPDGPIAKYEWDLDGDGNYEVDSGSNPITTRSYSTTGVYTVRLRVTDGQGVRNVASRAVSIDNSASGSYPSRVVGTTALLSYWRMGDSSGTTLIDSFGGSNATTSGGPALGSAGAISGDGDTAVSFDGANDGASANLSLSTTNKVTVEFWMKWNGYLNDDDLAMEYTPNFNSVAGGFLIDPNAPEQGGKFGVGIGSGASRNNVYFTRPSAGQWHHYAFVFDTAAAVSEEIKPYVDGQAVAFTKTASGTGAGNFANSSLNFMSRGVSALFGAGSLDEVAIYTRALDAATIAAHYAGNPQTPTPSLEATPNPASVGQTVSFNGSGSTSPNGAITKYEWDLDGNGSFETNTGTTATASTSYSSAGSVNAGLRVTDSAGKTATTSITVTVEASGSGSYSSRVLSTAGLINYWRMGDAAGTTLADSKGGAPATTAGTPSFGATGAVAGDADTAVGFNGTNSGASANLNLSGTNKLTLEFWMNWSAFANDDDLAFEFTPNFNSAAGGFLVDPNAPEEGGKFGVGVGSGEARNTAYFTRPSAGQWHHYALVFDTTASAETQITPYVDGKPVPYVKTRTGTGAGPFANSTLYFMSRAVSALFGAGALDEVALYNRALPATTIAQHFGGNSQAPNASFQATPNPAQTGQQVSFDGSASSDPDGTIAKYEWDLDGNGSFETNTGTTPTTTTTYSAAGNVEAKLRVTDDAGNSGQTTRSVTVEQAGSGGYSNRVLATAGLINYWRMGDAAGSTLADSRGSSPATVAGNPTFGLPGGLAGDANPAVNFNGIGDAASANLDLSGTNKLTLEFWMNWSTFANDDDLAFEFTPNFNSAPGGFLVDPNAPEEGGKFGVGIGNGSTRNTAYFTRPSAGQWHHYALVFDTTAPAESQVLPYVDGQPVPYVKTRSETGSGNFANSTLYFMSRASSALFGGGGLDEVALYNRALSAATIEEHFDGAHGGLPPEVSLSATPNPAQTGQQVTFDGSASTDTEGPIAKYEWDLDGNGSFETSSGTNPTVTQSYPTPRTLDVRLRVSDEAGNKTTTLRTLTVTNRAPSASFTATPSTVVKNQTVSFDGSGSTDPDGTITKYEWDLDGNGSFETNTGTTATTSRSYASAGNVEVKLRVTDNEGVVSSTSTKTVTVNTLAPTASFTATPNPANTGQSVSFNGAASSDTDGKITKYEWDLDGNGSFETNTGTTATTSKTYATAATVNVGLRVTDDDGLTNSTTRSLTVNNRLPTASFTVSPSPANTAQTVTFNGSGSTDPDGTIAKYEWDLDGNGTYETSTGTTATTTKAFTVTGTLTIGLRVTDNNSGTATTTRSLTVNSAYRAAVVGTSGISDYWRLDETTGTTATDANGGNNNGTYNSSPTSVAPLIGNETNSFARAFNGTSQYIDMSPSPFGTPSSFTAEAWVNTAATKTSGGYHFLISNSDSDLNNGFSLVIDSSNRPTFVVARENIIGSVTRGSAVSSTTVAPSTTHHIVGTYDGSRVRVYVDGVERANVSFGSGPSWDSGRDLRIGRPVSSTSLAQRYLQGTIDEPAIYTSALSAATVQAHYNAGKP